MTGHRKAQKEKFDLKREKSPQKNRKSRKDGLILYTATTIFALSVRDGGRYEDEGYVPG
ncbi:MAG: hypothetical protein IAC08_07790 [Bacteroidetes bacterium]|uniref:Uncharacterized protein n=1 Tax=Candidatus Cryptobacteroides intestinigallinarum TaxID=2840767 RepID=A0A9D9HLY3_9BACT|nr:hypothetical protein [Candidatus Cryptobacteroides intestinigallinarum]